MTNTLAARLLAEIERREERFPTIRSLCSADQSRELAYLAALRVIVGRHSERGGDCAECGDMTVLWPCPTVTAVAEALDVTP